MVQIFLALAALLPAIILCVYVFKKDRVEKEPIGLLLGLLALGALSCIPAGISEGVFESSILKPMFADHITVGAQEEIIIAPPLNYVYQFISAFFGVALFEEGFKFLFLYWATKKSKHFNSLFDGMIYAIFVSLGFAALENILYVFDGGIATAISRAILSVPGHMFFSVLMGYYYSLWHITDKADVLEDELVAKGVITRTAPSFDSTNQKILCLLMPILAHGFYDFCLFTGTIVGFLICVIFVVFLYVHCFKRIKKMSIADALTKDYAAAMVLRKHPALAEEIAIAAQEEMDSTPMEETPQMLEI